MKKLETGFDSMQLLLSVVTVAVTSLVAVPTYKAKANKEMIVEAINFASESKGKIERSFMVTRSLPRSNNEAKAMMSTTDSKPEFVRDIRIKPDRAGEKVLIKIVLSDGVVRNPTGERQYIYIAGSTTDEGKHAIEWRCGASGFEADLLPEECKS